MNLRTSLFIAEFYVWGVSFIKLSIILMLLRSIKGDKKSWKLRPPVQ